MASKRAKKKNPSSRGRTTTAPAPAADAESRGLRWVSLQQLHAESGMPIRTLNEIRRSEPDVLVVRQRPNQHPEYEQPTCVQRLLTRAHQQGKAAAKPTGAAPDGALSRAELRKAEADADISVMKADQMRRDLLPTADVRTELFDLVSALSGALSAMPTSEAYRFVNLATEIEAIEALKTLERLLRDALQNVRLPDLPAPEPAATEAAA